MSSSGCFSCCASAWTSAHRFGMRRSRGTGEPERRDQWSQRATEQSAIGACAAVHRLEDGPVCPCLRMLVTRAWARAAPEGEGKRTAARCRRYFCGGPKSSGGRSICGTSILILFRSTLGGLSSRPVTVTGKTITRRTMMVCSPIQGIAPQ